MLTDDKPELGPTGRFPDGQLEKLDEGELNVAMACDIEHRCVRLDFGTPVVWLALPPASARQLGTMLIQCAAITEARAAEAAAAALPETVQ